MAHGVREHAEAFGSDSFMDVVTNVVGILIILVLVVGVRVRQAPVEEAAPKPAADMAPLQRKLAALAKQGPRLAAEAAAIARRNLATRDEDAQLTAQIAAAQGRIAANKADQDEQARRASGRQRDRSTALAELDLLQQELDRVADSQPKAIAIESYLTPISKTVEGQEAHFQLQGGRVAFVPLEDLLAKLRADAREQIWKLRDLPDATSTVGPLGGFRMRFTLERVDITTDDKRGGTRATGSYARLSEWTLVPVSSQLGEPLDEALAASSEFRQALTRFDPRRATVTIWVYPDSFAEFRRLKKELFELGFATAGRPLPAGHPIGGSPDGSKSAAQ